jgi:hypothetical protein
MKTLRKLLAGRIATACALGLATAGLAACGDSGTTTEPAPDTVVADTIDTTGDVTQSDSTDDVAGDTTDQDVVKPEGRDLCAPCVANVQCAGAPDAVCVDFGKDGAFCGAKCAVDKDCADGYGCADAKDVTGAAVKQCVPKDGAVCKCSEAAIAAGWDTTCFAADAQGVNKCTGTRKCEAAGLTACSAKAPTAEICDGLDNDCNAATDDVSCDDSNQCTEDSCAGKDGCKNAVKTGTCNADDSLCTNGDYCTKAAKCEPGPTLECNDKNPCTDDICDPAKGCVFTNNTASCDADGDACTVADTCKDGACVKGEVKTCETGDPCLSGSCDKTSGDCLTAARPDGTPCDDASACTMKDVCLAADATSSTCGGELIDCDDKDACSADSCDPLLGCKHANLDGPVCDDGDACTEQDACKVGKCSGTAVDSATVCDDKDPCTVDACVPSKGCVHDPAGADGVACDDGNPCTPGDKCTSGTCIPGANQCSCAEDKDCAASEDGNACNGTLFCDKTDPVKWVCNVKLDTVVKCDETVNNQCQTVACNPGDGQCVVTKAVVGTGCNADDDLCTVNDACADGQCVKGQAQKCDDANLCTDDACDPKTGCTFTVNTAPCDADGNACTENDVCAGGSCVAGLKKVCEDKENCTKDACDPTTGTCVFQPIAASCDDGNACTSGDACGTNPVTKAYTCVSGAAANCDDNNPCTADTCAKDSGCSHKVDTSATAACFPGDPKNQGKGKCKDGLKTCQADGTYGICKDAVLPANSESCNGIDDTCDGITDEGCEPGAATVDFGTAAVNAAGNTYGTQTYVGTSVVTGEASGGEKYFTRLGWYVWLRALIGQ